MDLDLEKNLNDFILNRVNSVQIDKSKISDSIELESACKYESYIRGFVDALEISQYINKNTSIHAI